MGHCRLTRAEIRLWEEDESVQLAPWERRAIFHLDEEWIAAMSPKPEKAKTGPGTHYVA